MSDRLHGDGLQGVPCRAFCIGWFSTSAMEFRVCFTYTDTRDTDVDETRII